MDFNAIIQEESIESYTDIVRQCLSEWLEKNPTAKMIGINILFSGVFPRALEIADIIKSLDTERKVALGGIHPTLHHKEILENCSSIDHVVVGEGEKEFLSLLNQYSTSDQHPGVPAQVNINPPRPDERTIIFAPTTTKRNISELGTTDYSGINFDRYHSPDIDEWYNPKQHDIKCAVPVSTSRSCPFACNFCSIHAVHGAPKTFRYRPAADVIEEIKRLHNESGINYFYIVDDCANCNKKAAIELYSGIAKSEMDISLEFQSGLRISTLDGEVIDAMVAAGMVRAGLAIESGSDLIRNKIVGKTLPQEKIYETYEYFQANHPQIWLLAFFIIGLPEETHETLDDTENLAKELEWIYPVFNTATPHSGTPLWDQCVADDLLLFDPTDAWKNIIMHGFGQHSQPWTMKHAHVTLNPESIVIKPYQMTVEELRQRRNSLLALQKEKLSKVKNHLLAE